MTEQEKQARSNVEAARSAFYEWLWEYYFGDSYSQGEARLWVRYSQRVLRTFEAELEAVLALSPGS